MVTGMPCILTGVGSTHVYASHGGSELYTPPCDTKSWF